MDDMRNASIILVRKFGKKRPLGGRVLKWIIIKWDVRIWTGLSRMRILSGGGFLCTQQ
jgi:hypothetical protein